MGSGRNGAECATSTELGRVTEMQAGGGAERRTGAAGVYRGHKEEREECLAPGAPRSPTPVPGLLSGMKLTLDF